MSYNHSLNCQKSIFFFLCLFFDFIFRQILLTLWCVLWLLSTAPKTQPPTIHGLDLDHRIFCGNEVHYIGE